MRNKTTDTPKILGFEKPIAELQQKLEDLNNFARENQVDISGSIGKLEKQIEQLRQQTYERLTRWQKVEIARHPSRPRALDYIRSLCDEFIELHGDRQFADDKAMIGGFGRFNQQTVMFIGQQKGQSTADNLYRNFGMANPEGYRKAGRLMQIAEKFNKPIVTFIDTPGAFPGLEAEQRGQGEAIAQNLKQMFNLSVPVVCIVIGEGASGGALGIGIGDRVLMLEYTWYSVISPESCSQILWRNWDYKEQAADALKLSAPDSLKAGIIDAIIAEPLGGAHKNPLSMVARLKDVLIKELANLSSQKPDFRRKERINRFTRIGPTA